MPPLIKYSFNKVFGKNHPYALHSISDSILKISKQEIKEWKRKIKHMVEIYYPILFSEVKDGDINKLLSIIEGARNMEFESCVKNMLNLQNNHESIDIIGN